MPNWDENVARSDAAVGSSNASTIPIVCPLPSPLSPYAPVRFAGVSAVAGGVADTEGEPALSVTTVTLHEASRPPGLPHACLYQWPRPLSRWGPLPLPLPLSAEAPSTTTSASAEARRNASFFKGKLLGGGAANAFAPDLRFPAAKWKDRVSGKVRGTGEGSLGLLPPGSDPVRNLTAPRADGL